MQEELTKKQKDLEKQGIATQEYRKKRLPIIENKRDRIQ